MFCRNCGKKVPDGAAFCPNCGVQILKTDGADDKAKQKRADSTDNVIENTQERLYVSSEGKNRHAGSHRHFPWIRVILVLIAIAAAAAVVIVVSYNRQSIIQTKDSVILKEKDSSLSAFSSNSNSTETYSTQDVLQSKVSSDAVLSEQTSDNIHENNNITLTPIPNDTEIENDNTEQNGTAVSGDGNLNTDADGYSMDETLTLYCGDTVSAHQFLYPELSTEQISQETMDSWLNADVEKMRYDSQYAIDEIFVRYGYDFSKKTKKWTEDLIADYSGRSWYEDAIAKCPSDNQYTLMTQYMSDIERNNIDTIVQWQNVYVPPEED